MNVDNVLVDVGTGYYLEKNVEDATDYYKRKVDFIKGNSMRLQDTINTKQSNRQAVELIMQHKVQVAMEEQKEQAAASSSG